MNCKCGGYSRQQSNEQGRRQYKCGSCQRNFYTVELHEIDVAARGLLYVKDQLNKLLIKEARFVLKDKGYLK